MTGFDHPIHLTVAASSSIIADPTGGTIQPTAAGTGAGEMPCELESGVIPPTIGAILAASPETSLRLGLDQSFVSETRVNGRSIDGSDQTIGTLSIGAASILGPGVLLNGAVDIGLTDDAPDYAVRASLPVQFDLPIY